MQFDEQRALALLRLGTGNAAAVFRDGQDVALRRLIEAGERLLVVQKTGWGKSAVYFVATKVLRDAGHGPTILVSPLIALMRNQLQAANAMGVRARTINASNTDDWADIEAALARDEVDLLLVSPERFRNARFKDQVLPLIARRVGLFVVDEAHCISEWGHDFRPDYRRIERLIANLPGNVRVLATTATATNRVIDDLQHLLGPGLGVLRGDLTRDALRLQSIVMPGRAERLAWLAEQLSVLPGSGIVYVSTVRDAQLVADWLRSQGLEVEAYSGDTDSEHRPVLEQALLDNRVKALVATSALGMGFDKPDLRFVLHYQSPGNVIAYYQQVGRAGRDGQDAYCVLLSGAEDGDIQEFFIRTAFPSRADVDAVLAAIADAPDGLTDAQLLAKVNLRKARVDKVLLLLGLESPAPIVKQGSKWMRTVSDVAPAFWERAEQLGRTRLEEWREMQHYASLADGHMRYLVEVLDGDVTQIGTSASPPLPARPSAKAVDDARRFLARVSYPLELRKLWPGGGLPRFDVSGAIAKELRAESGKVLGHWNDDVWGKAVQQGKHEGNAFADVLVDACVRLIDAWRPRPAPAWVTCVPSLRRPRLVPDFAARLAARLGLPFHEVLFQTAERPEQRGMLNTLQQAHNLDGSLAVSGALPSEPVLLVDDIVSSKWTLTIAAWLLRVHGAGSVFPLALAMRGGGDE